MKKTQILILLILFAISCSEDIYDGCENMPKQSTYSTVVLAKASGKV